MEPELQKGDIIEQHPNIYIPQIYNSVTPLKNYLTTTDDISIKKEAKISDLYRQIHEKDDQIDKLSEEHKNLNASYLKQQKRFQIEKDALTQRHEMQQNLLNDRISYLTQKCTRYEKEIKKFQDLMKNKFLEIDEYLIKLNAFVKDKCELKIKDINDLCEFRKIEIKKELELKIFKLEIEIKEEKDLSKFYLDHNKQYRDMINLYDNELKLIKLELNKKAEECNTLLQKLESVTNRATETSFAKQSNEFIEKINREKLCLEEAFKKKENDLQIQLSENSSVNAKLNSLMLEKNQIEEKLSESEAQNGKLHLVIADKEKMLSNQQLKINIFHKNIEEVNSTCQQLRSELNNKNAELKLLKKELNTVQEEKAQHTFKLEKHVQTEMTTISPQFPFAFQRPFENCLIATAQRIMTPNNQGKDESSKDYEIHLLKKKTKMLEDENNNLHKKISSMERELRRLQETDTTKGFQNIPVKETNPVSVQPLYTASSGIAQSCSISHLQQKNNSLTKENEKLRKTLLKYEKHLRQKNDQIGKSSEVLQRKSENAIISTLRVEDKITDGKNQTQDVQRKCLGTREKENIPVQSALAETNESLMPSAVKQSEKTDKLPESTICSSKESADGKTCLPDTLRQTEEIRQREINPFLFQNARQPRNYLDLITNKKVDQDQCHQQ